MQWIELQYRGFHDVPRMMVVRLPGGMILLDSPFVDAIDDYDDYTVYRLPLHADLSGSWDELAVAATAQLGRIRVDDVALDPSRRASIDLDRVRHLLPDDILQP
jgi:hypothetical protein